VRDGSALEPLAEIDTAVFDKTGVLTMGAPRLVDAGGIAPGAMAIASALAAASRHPLSRAIEEAGSHIAAPLPSFASIAEEAGLGIEGRSGGDVYRLGRPNWALAGAVATKREGAWTRVVLARNETLLATFDFEDALRPGAKEAAKALAGRGLDIEILSGDRRQAVAGVAGAAGIPKFEAGMLPGAKAGRIVALTEAGRKVLMVGDGLNDVPALAAAHVSMAPASAADVGRSTADFVFLRPSLAAVPMALEVAVESGRLIRQNFALAVGYNIVAVPVAILGDASPLVAAIAMSLSSLLVIANAMRLGQGKMGLSPASPERRRGTAMRTEAAR
jgi:Cu2+-exporting ATPase